MMNPKEPTPQANETRHHEFYDPTAILFCEWNTGLRPTDDQLRRAKERVENQKWDFFKQSQYELSTIEIVMEDLFDALDTDFPPLDTDFPPLDIPFEDIDTDFPLIDDSWEPICESWRPLRKKTKLNV